jgi:outer membrane protein assembly factor BamB
VDAACLIHNDSIFIGLENGFLEILDPLNEHLTKNGDFYSPGIFEEIPLFNDSDVIFHKNNLIVESSPAKLNERIYIASGSGHVFGYNTISHKLDWDYYIGADIDGSTVITKDSCILIGFEKQYLEGYGGVFKINPSYEKNRMVQWFFPVENSTSNKWGGGVVGSVGIDDLYNSDQNKKAAFVGVNGILYVVNHNVLSEEKVQGPHLKDEYYKPKLIFKKNIGSSVSTPIFVQDKLIVSSSEGLWLFKIFEDKIELLDQFDSDFEATPVVYNNRIYIASTDGFLYCFG